MIDIDTSVQIEPLCPICRHKAFTWGYASDEAFALKFRDGNPPYLFAPLFPALPEDLNARKCDHCGNIQLFADKQLHMHVFSENDPKNSLTQTVESSEDDLPICPDCGGKLEVGTFYCNHCQKLVE